ncbi:MAG TPA: cytochrome c3 family protein [Blastocatellia bacterium]|nr:cytochrome c3 family protein [Blastocatellia bacterium]
MKLKLLIIACFVTACWLTIAGQLVVGQAAREEQKMPGDNVIIPSVDDKWGEVKFTHQQHLAFSDCTYCHHTNKGLTSEGFNAGKSEKIPLCAECHVRSEGDAKTPQAADGLELWSKEAYHINCIDCHKGEITRKPADAGAVLKQGAGPVKCAACHEVKD